MTRVAYLVLAHNHPTLLARLLDAVAAPWAHAFVHVDAKSDRAMFDQVLKGRSDCTLVPASESLRVNWAGFSFLRATFLLLRRSLKDGRGFQRFSLLSGVDYPIKSKEKIKELFASDLEIIRVDRALDPEGNTLFDRRANRVSIGDHPLTNARSAPRLARRITHLLEGRLPRTRAPLPLYYGGAWWALTRRTVEQILARADARPELFGWFRFCHCPEEMFFQTMVKEMPIADRIAFDLTRGVDAPDTAHGSHYVDFTGPDPSSPRILTLHDLPSLLASDVPFARKFDPVQSAALLDELDRINGGCFHRREAMPV